MGFLVQNPCQTHENPTLGSEWAQWVNPSKTRAGPGRARYLGMDLTKNNFGSAQPPQACSRRGRIGPAQESTRLGPGVSLIGQCKSIMMNEVVILLCNKAQLIFVILFKQALNTWNFN